MLKFCFFCKMLSQAGGGGPFTLFAPTNSAFDLVIQVCTWGRSLISNVVKVGRDAMLGDVPGLRKALLRHIVRLSD